MIGLILTLKSLLNSTVTDQHYKRLYTVVGHKPFFMSMQSTNKRILQVIWSFTTPHRKWVYLSIAGFTIAELVSLMSPILVKQLFDELALKNSSQGDPYAIITNIAIVYLVAWIVYRVGTNSSTIYQSRTIFDITSKSEEYLLGHSHTFFSNNFAGSLVRKLNRLARSFEVIADLISFNYTPLIISIIGSTAILAWRHPFLGAMLLVWITVFLSLNVVYVRWKQKYERELSELDSSATGELSDQVSNIDNVRLFDGNKYENERFKLVLDKVRRLRVFVWRVNDVMDATQVLLIIAIEVGMYTIAVKLWRQNLLTIGDFALIQGYLIAVFNQIWRFGRTMRDTYTALADGAEMVSILDTPHEICDVRNSKDLVVTRGSIEYRDVSFSFHKTRTVLNKLNLYIQPGQHIALVGSSGAGKSTITKLLLRLHDIDNGKILIDYQDIAKVTQNSLRSNIALVPQEAILFHRSLMDNIRYGRRSATDDEVYEAAKMAYCDRFIDNLPHKYATLVGERGIKLSGGERQRIAIARALLKNAPILILDEATSSLDSESEALIQDALHKLMENRTTIVIAHRLSTIMSMDRILVVDEGGVVADGTHTELLESNDIYRKLWQIQVGGYLP